MLRRRVRSGAEDGLTTRWSGKTGGVAAILAASVIWAAEPILAKLSYRTSDPLETSTVRALLVALVALAYALGSGRGNLKVHRRDLGLLAFLALAGTLCGDLLYLYCLAHAPVVNALILGHFQALFIVAIGFFALKGDRMTRFDAAGIALMIVAAVLVSSKTASNLAALRFGSVWDALILCSALSWAAAAVAMRRWGTHLNVGTISFYRFAFSFVVMAAMVGVRGGPIVLNPYQVWLGLAIGVGALLYYAGLKRIKAAQVSALELSAPLFGAVLAFVVLGEGVTGMQVGGGVLLGFGVYFLSRKEEIPVPDHP